MTRVKKQLIQLMVWPAIARTVSGQRGQIGVHCRHLKRKSQRLSKNIGKADKFQLVALIHLPFVHICHKKLFTWSMHWYALVSHSLEMEMGWIG